MKQTFIGKVLWWTPRAMLFQDHFWHEPEWYPLSQIEVKSVDLDHMEYIIVASNWITQQKGIYEFAERIPNDG